MPTSASPFIPMDVGIVAPVGTPPIVLADQGADRWELVAAAVGGTLTLTASAGTPAILWGYDVLRCRWRILEEEWRTTSRVLADGEDLGDLVQRSVPEIGALFVQYEAITDLGTAEFFQRTIREVVA